MKQKWNWDIQVVEYPQLAKVLEEARAETGTLERMRQLTDEYLKLPGTRWKQNAPTSRTHFC